jgi:exonuclease SbcD
VENDKLKLRMNTKNTYRILHTSDWHLGKMLNEMPREEEHRRFLDWLLQQVIEHEVDAVLVAGDVFDTANPPQSAEALYFNFVAELHAKTRASLVLVAGNHDSPSQLEAPRQALKALRTHVVGTAHLEPSARLLPLPSAEAPRVVLAMLPFLRDRDIRQDKSGESATEIRKALTTGIQRVYDETAQAAKSAGHACPIVATGHLTVTGATSSDSEREIHIGGLGSVEASIFPDIFSYVALGHLHRPQSVGKRDHIRYSGSPILLSFSEANHEKEMRLIEISEAEVTHRPIAIPLFRKLVQLQTSVDTLKADLKSIAGHPTGELTTWVEVILSGSEGLSDPHEHVQSLAREIGAGGFEVLKVIRAQLSKSDGPTRLESEQESELETLLDQPMRVFEHVLEQQTELEDAQKEPLRLALSEVLDALRTTN